MQMGWFEWRIKRAAVIRLTLCLLTLVSLGGLYWCKQNVSLAAAFYDRYPLITLVVFWALLLVLPLISLGAIADLRHPHTHQVWARLHAWGDAEQLAYQIEAEFPKYEAKLTGWRFTQNFAICATLFDFDVFRLDDIVWVHQREAGISLSAMPSLAGKLQTVIFQTADDRFSIEASHQRIHKIMRYLRFKMPWVIFGADELQRQFPGSTWQKVVEEVANRRVALAKTPDIIAELLEAGAKQ